MLDGPFRGSAAVARGLVTLNHLSGSGFRRLFPDVYLPADRPLDLATRSRAAYLLVHERGGLLGGYSAAALLGADCAPFGTPAEVVVRDKYRPHPGLEVRYRRVDEAEVTTIAGCRVTTARRTAWDLARRLPLIEAMASVDALARLAKFAPAELLTRREAEPGAWGARRLDDVVALANPAAQSPMESRLRVRLVLGGLPPPEVQYRIVDEHGFVVARPDLAYPDAKLAIEYDGGEHFERRRTERDRYRDARLAELGWFTLRLGPDQVGAADTIRRVRDLLELRSPRAQN